MMTNDERTNITNILNALDKADNKISEMIKPFRDAAMAVDEARETILEAYATDVFSSCEGCGEMIFTGDKYQPTGDAGPLCEECAATWGDIKKQCEKMLASPDYDDEDQEDRKLTLQAAIDHVANGGSYDDKPLSTA